MHTVRCYRCRGHRFDCQKPQIESWPPGWSWLLRLISKTALWIGTFTVVLFAFCFCVSFACSFLFFGSLCCFYVFLSFQSQNTFYFSLINFSCFLSRINFLFRALLPRLRSRTKAHQCAVHYRSLQRLCSTIWTCLMPPRLTNTFPSIDSVCLCHCVLAELDCGGKNASCCVWCAVACWIIGELRSYRRRFSETRLVYGKRSIICLALLCFVLETNTKERASGQSFPRVRTHTHTARPLPCSGSRSPSVARCVLMSPQWHACGLWGYKQWCDDVSVIC